VLGFAAMLTTIALVVRGARAARARLVPDASLPLACLVVILLTVGCITIVSEVLGTIGLFHVVPLAIAFAGAGIVLARIAPVAPKRETSPPPSKVPRAITGATFFAVFVVIGEWVTATVLALHNGITVRDSIWYHLPTAARFAQSGSTWDLHTIDTTSLAVFYPAGSEVIHAIGMEFLGTDALSRTLSFGWLIVGLLAAWCIGARFGVGPLTLLAAAVLFATPQLVRVDAGQGLNDMAVIALVLGAIALIITCAPARGSWLGRGSLFVAGLVAGLAIGTKWTALAPVAALTIGIPFLVQRGQRVRSFLLWLAALFAGGGYWYLRNLVHVGSPVPPLRIGVGPLHFTQIHTDLPTFSIAGHLGDSGVWRDQFHPGLRLVFGPAWWSLLALCIVGFVIACMTSRERTVWIATFVGVATFVSYLFVEQAFSIAEWSATARFTAPGFALALIVFAVAVARRSRRAQLLTLVLFGVTVIATQLDSQLWKAWWRIGGIKVFFVAMVGTAFVAILGAVVSRAGTRRLMTVALPTAIAALVVISLVGGVAIARYQPRFVNRGQPVLTAARMLHKRHVTHSRIAVTGDLFVAAAQYYLYDKRLTNYVQFLGSPGAHHTVRPFRSCDAFIGSIKTGRYDYVVAQAAPGPNNPITWLRSDPSAREIFSDPGQRVGLFEIVGSPRRTGCV
jgi:hypothetical protein